MNGGGCPSRRFCLSVLLYRLWVVIICYINGICHEVESEGLRLYSAPVVVEGRE